MTHDEITFLESQRVARLATVDEHGRPHVVPVCYALVDELIYTPIDEKPKRDPARPLRRVRNLLAHPDVCLVVDVYDEDWSRLAWLQVRGIASLVEDPDERARALAALRRRYRQYETMDLESRALIRITPARIVGWRATPSPAERGRGA